MQNTHTLTVRVFVPFSFVWHLHFGSAYFHMPINAWVLCVPSNVCVCLIYVMFVRDMRMAMTIIMVLHSDSL